MQHNLPSRRLLYQQFCQQVPDLPVFAQPWYLDAVCEGGEVDVAVVRYGELLVAAMPYFLKRKRTFSLPFTMPYFCKYL